MIVDNLKRPHPRVKVLGVGNLLLRDEGVGVRVIEYIMDNGLLPQDIEVIDGGTGGMRLIPIIQDADHLIIIDAVRGGGRPGDIYRLTIGDLPLRLKQKTSLHEVGLQEVFSIINLLEKRLPEIVIIGVEPKKIDYGIGLTPEVGSVLPEVALKIKEEVKRILKGGEKDN
ncbi:MAG: HyaD/HybD family hydrogenase maturation endopeptidase [Deltaproteobacteria bacterium]|nr:HyaD/HybD family hydrogenase maturation endopeptidase [Deltaproteobacteria bacterium]